MFSSVSSSVPCGKEDQTHLKLKGTISLLIHSQASIKAGFHLNAIFMLLNTGLMDKSHSHFIQSKTPSLSHESMLWSVLQIFGSFLGIMFGICKI